MAKSLGRMSRNKGKRGELEVSKMFQEVFIEATTGRQHSGSPDSPDVLLPEEIRYLLHVEVKRCERIEMQSWLKQVQAECGKANYSVFFRSSREPWRVVIDARFFLKLIAAYIPKQVWKKWIMGEEDDN